MNQNQRLECVQRTLVRGAATVLMLAVAAAMLPLCSSCVTSGDLREVADSIDRYHEGQLTTDELKQEIGSVADQVDERTREAVKSPMTGNPLIDLLIAGGVAAATGYTAKRSAVKTVNKQRDANRKQRGEPTA